MSISKLCVIKDNQIIQFWDNIINQQLEVALVDMVPWTRFLFSTPVWMINSKETNIKYIHLVHVLSAFKY